MPVWCLFVLCTALLILGYIFYGALIDRVFGVKPDQPTPVQELADGRDYIEMPTWKVFLIQLLDIAGLGPIFGPLLGALYGPIAMVWIVFGCIFGGAVHDYLSGMLSVRHQGKSIPNICGIYMGRAAEIAMTLFCIIVLVFTGIVFVNGPAGLLHLTVGNTVAFWTAVIFLYYFTATILPIDKIIGKIYPLFGGLLIFMAVSLIIALLCNPQYNTLPESFWTSSHPQGLPAWPLVFITIACGAVSGFHSTQSPLMSRCLSNEKYGRFTFYGAMISEGIIAMVWVLLGISFFHNGDSSLVAEWKNSAVVAHHISTALLGKFGSVLAMLGVIILPITSGDTAFRSVRLIIADQLNFSQDTAGKCLAIAIPLFIVGFITGQTDFSNIWRYFGWSNQTLATIVLWMGTVYLKKHGKNVLIALVPAFFMTMVIGTDFFYDELMHIQLPLLTSTIISFVIAIVFSVLIWRVPTTLSDKDSATEGSPTPA